MFLHNQQPAVVITRFPYESSWGGEESHTLNIARHLRQEGYNVIFMGSCTVLLEKFKAEGFMTKKVWGGKMIVTKWQLLKSFLLFPFIKRSLHKAFAFVMRAYELKALYCLSLNEKLFLSPYAVSKGVPVTWVEHQEIRGWLLKSPWRRIYRRNAADVKIVPISKQNERSLHKLKVSPKSIKEIINGVDIKSLAKLKRKTRKGLIVSANRFIPKKGMMDVLEAAKILQGESIDFSLRIVGEGEENIEIERFMRENFKVCDANKSNFLKKENWHELLSQCDVYVTASRDSNDTFNISAAEAMAAGCKLVVTSCTGIASYLHDGKDAVLAKPSDPQDLSKKIQKALKLPDSLRKKSQSTAKKNFDVKRMLKQYQDLILRS